MPRATPKPTKPRAATASRTVAVISDVHIPAHDGPSWRAFRAWHAAVRPWQTVMLGDLMDMAAVSRHEKGPEDPVDVLDEIKAFVREANALAAECGTLVIAEGNHEARFARYLAGATPRVVRGLKGLTLREQCVAQGLRSDVAWFRESNKTRGILVGDILLRHGDKQSSRFGGGVHVAATQLGKSFGQSVLVGHFHRAGLHTKTAGGRTFLGIANPCLAGDMDYAVDPDWARGFSVIELHAPHFKRATAYPIVMHDGVFAWGGKTYDGNATKPRGAR